MKCGDVVILPDNTPATVEKRFLCFYYCVWFVGAVVYRDWYARWELVPKSLTR